MNPISTITPPAPPDTKPASARPYLVAASLVRRLGWDLPFMSISALGITIPIGGANVAESRADLHALACAVGGETVWWDDNGPSLWAGRLETTGEYKGIPVTGTVHLGYDDAARLGFIDCPRCLHSAHANPCTDGIFASDGLPSCCDCRGLGDVPRDVEPHVLDAVALAVQALSDDERHGAVWDAVQDAAREARADAYFQQTGSAGDLDAEDAS